MANTAIANPQVTILPNSSRGWFKSQWYKPLGQAFELLSVVVLVVPFGLFWSQLSTAAISMFIVTAMLVMLIFFGAAVFCLDRAVKEAKKAADEAERINNSRMHVISDARLLVLKEEKVARDAFEILRKLNHSALSFEGGNLLVKTDHPSKELPISTADLTAILLKELGKERTDEVKDLILKYTLQYVETSNESANCSNPGMNSQAQEPAAVSNNPVG